MIYDDSASDNARTLQLRDAQADPDASASEPRKIRIVVPVYNEAKNLRRLVDAISEAIESLDRYSWELVFVDDGSKDASWDEIAKLTALANPQLKIEGISLSRNFGKEVALSCGLLESGDVDAIVCMDADLQHPPRYLKDLVREWEGGADIVATVRLSTKNKSLVRSVGSHAYYWLMKHISDLEMTAQTTDFRLYDRKVVAVFKRFTERGRLFRGIMDWIGFEKVYVEFDADAREVGEVVYSIRKLIRLAISSVTAFSLFPLRVVGYLGASIMIITGLLIIWMLLAPLVSAAFYYTPLALFVVANTFLFGVVLSAIGLLALYIANIHTEVINRPLYIVRDRVIGP
jgi:polyisoprenyl-phosphate glycosyltransferase